MLVELHIKNFALIDEVRFEPGNGFNTLTGETGAGKSIIVDAMSAVIGERTSAEVIRTGEEKCMIQALFDVSDNKLAVLTACNLGFEPEDGSIIISREINRQGKSICRVNGQITTASVIRDITSKLIDIHGQHEHQSLLSVPLHIEIFDAWRIDEVFELKVEIRKTFEKLVSVRSEIKTIKSDATERAHLLDLYKFQLNEIETANIISGELDELLIEKKRLTNVEKLFIAANEIYEALSSDDGAIDKISSAFSSAEKAIYMDSTLSKLSESLNSALVSVQDAFETTKNYRDKIEADPERIEIVEERIDLIKMLIHKYGNNEDEVLKHVQGLRIKLNNIEHTDEKSNELESELQELENHIITISQKLSGVRKNIKESFEKAVESELADLAMEKTKFVVNIEQVEPGPNGCDFIEFLISPNPGEPLKPLTKIASGGEMSRISLALKTASNRTEVPTLVFDEIDAGIGGRVAQVLGEKLAVLSKKCQILCVTHLPQVASKAQKHFSVRKEVECGRSLVLVNALDNKDRVIELARMLGADEASQTAIQHAKEMLSIAN